MFRKILTIDLLKTIGLLILLLEKISKAQVHDNSVTLKDESADKLDNSVISGIRMLEYMRRRIVDSSREERNNFRQVPSSIDYNQRDYPRYVVDSLKSDEKIGQTSYNPRRQINSEIYDALAKFANIRFAIPYEDEKSRLEQSFNYKNSNEPFNVGKFLNSTNDERNSNNNQENHDIKISSSPNNESTELSKIFNNTRLITRKFHCRPISEIYVPRVDKKMPAYLCNHAKRAFVITSERFNQESREHFFVSLDDKTYKLLNPINTGMTKLTSAVSVLPATLVLKRGDDDYTVRGVKDNNSIFVTKVP